ncbi:hypothetical protein GWK91_02475 [Virgibacillus sp. MSP4-1]|uniref:hypothetical protein n=1 Tax=Virgibacillus sp. MSP4-1 TaxID=2700081 RepID=UPI00039EEA52|nr:hypothetical protein [Virgibacillus sp. MSP4-1]QHS21875.1 hypothetical protein GWK91_02475 [Virgibacillus sp. MSP4-1]
MIVALELNLNDARIWVDQHKKLIENRDIILNKLIVSEEVERFLQGQYVRF